MKRNLLILCGSLALLLFLSFVVHSKLALLVLSGITAVLALLGATTVCLVSAPVCVPAISVGLITFLAGLGLSFKSIALVMIGLLVGSCYVGYKAYKVWKARRQTKLT